MSISLEQRRIVLASASPRRLALLQAACFQVEVRVSGADETWPGGDPHEATKTLARRKLEAVPEPTELTLAADTVVLLDGEMLGKPRNDADAAVMLNRLSGRGHQVVTGFCLRRGAGRVDGAVSTRVWFRTLCEQEIYQYIATGEAADKAGAYAIQGGAAAFIDRIEGSYTNVVGLPMTETLEAVERLP